MEQKVCIWACALAPHCFIAEIGVILFCGNQEGFTGNYIKNPDFYLLDIGRMNTKVGKVLVQFKNSSNKSQKGVTVHSVPSNTLRDAQK